MRKSVFFVLAAAALVFVLQTQETSPLVVIAHRGGGHEAPENTLAALEQAVDTGVDIAEFDLRLTKDGNVVALHDPTLENGALAADLNAAQLPDQIPSLSALLEAAKGRIHLILDLKERTPALVDRTITLIQSHQMEEQCVLGASSTALLERCKALAPGIDTLYIGQSMPDDLSCADGCSIWLWGLNSQDVSAAHEQGCPVYVWTVNDPLSAEAARRLGVDGIVTDVPSVWKRDHSA